MPPHPRPARGYTLIEVMVTLVIVALLFSVTTVGIGALVGVKAKSAAGELSGVIRFLYDTAAVSGKTCRLVFDLSTEKEGRPVSYQAECASGNVTAARDRETALKDANRERADRENSRGRSFLSGSQSTLDEVMSREKDRVEQSARFSGFTSPEIKSRTLPGAVRLSVWTQHQKDPVKSGLAYLYFFPQGYTEKAQVYVRQGTNVWTISVSPLTGKTKVVGEELEVPKS